MRLTRNACILAGVLLVCPLYIVPGEPFLQTPPAPVSPAEALRSARSIFIKTKSVYFKPATLENALLKRDEFLEWDLAITRVESDADLIIEVDRKLFTSKFVFSVIDRRTERVVAAGKVDSIGGTVEGKISDSFVKKMRLARSAGDQGRVK
jgi:hypothetical protein